MPNVFISYSAKDRTFIRQLVKQLEGEGVDVRLDENALSVGDDIPNTLGSAIADAQYVVVAISHASLQSDWVRLELSAALSKELRIGRKVVIPLLVESVDHSELPPLLWGKKYADFSADPRLGFNQLIQALRPSPLLDSIASRTLLSERQA